MAQVKKARRAILGGASVLLHPKLPVLCEILLLFPRQQVFPTRGSVRQRFQTKACSRGIFCRQDLFIRCAYTKCYAFRTPPCARLDDVVVSALDTPENPNFATQIQDAIQTRPVDKGETYMARLNFQRKNVVQGTQALLQYFQIKTNDVFKNDNSGAGGSQYHEPHQE